MARTSCSSEVDKMINVAVIMGRLTADPELKTTQGALKMNPDNQLYL